MARFQAEQYRSLFAMEEAVLRYWEENKTYQKSLAKNADGAVFSFYDGPPFITGIPHYATLLPSIVKDIIPRYQTMRGRQVRRIWGWDVHGLPAENQVEKKLGLKTKKDIEALGVAKFIDECRKYVAETSDAWKWYIDHIGRWADLDKPYRTDDLSYMESVMSAFKTLYDKGLIYRGRRTSLYCPRCATPLSKFEVTMDEGSYKDVTDPGVTVAFRLNNDDVALLAWTTTPWTLPANYALAVDPAAEYVKVTNGHQTYVLAHQSLERYRDQDFEILETFKGETMIGWQYEPLYSFKPGNPHTDYRVLAADFVTMEDGTGIVHIAPGFGEDDTKLGEANNLSLFETLTDEGHFTTELGQWGGLYYKKADQPIIEDLKARGLLVKQETISHSYPHCYRCGTPLIYKSQVAWYLSIEPLRAMMLATNQTINWLPKHLGEGRFKYNLETAPDWSLSRTRYWGSPIPVWETEDGEIFVPGSIAELEKYGGQKVTDLHRPFIDEVELTLPNGKRAKRVKEVLDCWFESGAMPYAQDHYPFENEKVFAAHFPADFIVEYTGQLRGWFYYLHVLGNALQDSIAFRNVLVHGVVLGNDGRKMSKSFGNYPDPKATIEKYGAEAIRLFFMSSPVMRGDEVAVKEEDIRDYSRVLNVFHNSFRYFLTYAQLHNWEQTGAVGTNVMDRWIIVRLHELADQIQKGLDAFDLMSATRAIRPFIDDLSTWYIRRSRDRFVAGDTEALQTLHDVLLGFAVSVAPILPFTSELVYRTLSGKESVHLENFPAVNEPLIAESVDLLTTMEQVREIASIVHMLRAQAGHNLRQPLATLKLANYPSVTNDPTFSDILASEANVKIITSGKFDAATWIRTGTDGRAIWLDTTLTPELEEEGTLREIIRLAQEARKTANLQVGQKVAARYVVGDQAWGTIIDKNRDRIMAAAGFSDLKLESDSSEKPVEFKF